MNWSIGDFVFAAGLLLLAGALILFAVKSRRPVSYRLGAVIAVLGILLMVMACGAVGLIGDAEHPGNLLLLCIPASGLFGAAIFRFRPDRLYRVLVIMALAQMLIAAMALAQGWGSLSAVWPWDVIAGNGFFAAAWLFSAAMFRASRAPRLSA